MNFKKITALAACEVSCASSLPQPAFRDGVELLSVALEIWTRGLTSEQSLVPPINENFLTCFLEPCDTDKHSATKILKSLERLGIFLSDYCIQSCGHFRHHTWKKKSLSLLELRFCLKFYLWGIGEKIGRNVELDHKNISRCSTTTNY